MSAYLLVLFAIATRVGLAVGSHQPHIWWNFTATGGSLLFFGGRRPLREMWLPLASLMATDFFLTRYAYGFPFHAGDYLMTWVWYAGVILLGSLLLARRASVGRVVAASVASSTAFFLVSNFVGFYPVTMYPHTWQGAMAAYAAGVPFYKNDLASTLLVAGVAFGCVALAERRRHKLAVAELQATV